jgi:hypothetical protein
MTLNRLTMILHHRRLRSFELLYCRLPSIQVQLRQPTHPIASLAANLPAKARERESSIGPPRNCIIPLPNTALPPIAPHRLAPNWVIAQTNT